MGKCADCDYLDSATCERCDPVLGADFFADEKKRLREDLQIIQIALGTFYPEYTKIKKENARLRKERDEDTCLLNTYKDKLDRVMEERRELEKENARLQESEDRFCREIKRQEKTITNIRHENIDIMIKLDDVIEENILYKKMVEKVREFATKMVEQEFTRDMPNHFVHYNFKVVLNLLKPGYYTEKEVKH